MPTRDKEHAKEVFRAAVLAALDEASISVFGKAIPESYQNKEGSVDADLPTLFATVDQHLDKLAYRFGYNFAPEGYVGSERYMAERAELEKVTGNPPIQEDALPVQQDR